MSKPASIVSLSLRLFTLFPTWASILTIHLIALSGNLRLSLPECFQLLNLHVIQFLWILHPETLPYLSALFYIHCYCPCLWLVHNGSSLLFAVL